MRLAKTQKKVMKQVNHGHSNSLTQLTLTSQTSSSIAKVANEGQRTGVTTPNKTSEGWGATLQSPKEGKEKDNWGENSG